MTISITYSEDETSFIGDNKQNLNNELDMFMYITLYK